MVKKSNNLTDHSSLMENSHFHSHSSPLGVCTRSRARALRQQGKGLYIQLRNRRLHKKLFMTRSGSKTHRHRVNHNSEFRGEECSLENENAVAFAVSVHSPIQPPSFGHNLLQNEEAQGEDAHRNSRETTPCNLIRNPNFIQTPTSSTRRPRSSFQPNRVIGYRTFQVPDAQELDVLFGAVEKDQQKKFKEKYNFDIVNDKPLPGRYEWVKMKP